MTNREPHRGVDGWPALRPPPKHTSGTPRPKDVFDDRGRSPGSRVGAVPSGLPSAGSASGRWTESSPLTVAGAASASTQNASPNSLLAPEQSGEPRSRSPYKAGAHRQAPTGRWCSMKHTQAPACQSGAPERRLRDAKKRVALKVRLSEQCRVQLLAQSGKNSKLRSSPSMSQARNTKGSSTPASRSWAFIFSLNALTDRCRRFVCSAGSPR